MRWSLAQDNDDPENKDWIIVKYRYHEPYIFQLFKDGVEIVPNYPFDKDPATGEIVDLLDHVDTCGKAVYDNTIDTIHFVLNKRDTCFIDIHMVSSIKVIMKFDLNYDDFFKNDAKQTFS